MQKIIERKEERERLRNDRGPCNARNAEFEHDHKDHIQHDVQHAADGQIDRRAVAVAHGAQDGCGEIVHHGKGHADEDDAHVERRLIDDVGGRVHQLQHSARAEQADHADQQAADGAHGDGGVHAFLDRIAVARAEGPCYHNARADRKADEKVREQRRQRTRGAHGRQRGRAGEAADDGHVRHVEQDLQKTGQHQRDGEFQNRRDQRRVEHIHVAAQHVESHCQIPFFLHFLS